MDPEVILIAETITGPYLLPVLCGGWKMESATLSEKCGPVFGCAVQYRKLFVASSNDGSGDGIGTRRFCPHIRRHTYLQQPYRAGETAVEQRAIASFENQVESGCEGYF